MALPKIPNPLKRKPLNSLVSTPCVHSHLTEHPHPKHRWAQGIGYFTWNDEAQAFLFDPHPFKPHKIGELGEEYKLKTGPHSFIWCVEDFPQVTLESIPGWNSPAVLANTHVGLGAHVKQYADPATLRHMKSYSGRIPTHPGAGKWVLPDNHVDDDWKFGQFDHAPIS